MASQVEEKKITRKKPKARKRRKEVPVESQTTFSRKTVERAIDHALKLGYLIGQSKANPDEKIDLFAIDEELEITFSNLHPFILAQSYSRARYKRELVPEGFISPSARRKRKSRSAKRG